MEFGNGKIDLSTDKEVRLSWNAETNVKENRGCTGAEAQICSAMFGPCLRGYLASWNSVGVLR